MSPQLNTVTLSSYGTVKHGDIKFLCLGCFPSRAAFTYGRLRQEALTTDIQTDIQAPKILPSSEVFFIGLSLVIKFHITAVREAREQAAELRLEEEEISASRIY